MPYECKVYDKNGKLKKILSGDKAISKKSKKFLNQPSTKKAMDFIKNLKSPKDKKAKKLYSKECVICGEEFHARHPRSKYCSHECQKKMYFKRKLEGLIEKKINNKT